MPIDALQLAKKLTGKFIVFDGPDGCGKGTQLDLLEARLTDGGCRVVRGKDPGGTVIGDRIRQVVLGYDRSEMDVSCETLLFMASRAQLIGEVVRPAVADGKTVLCDRFVSATCAYQGAQGYDVRQILELAPSAIGDCWPDVTVVLDLDAETGFARTGRKPHHVGKNRKRHAGQQQDTARNPPERVLLTQLATPNQHHDHDENREDQHNQHQLRPSRQGAAALSRNRQHGGGA